MARHGLSGLVFFGGKGDDDLPLSRTIQLNQNYPLPSSQDQRTLLEGQPQRRSDERRENVIGYVRRVMGVTVFKFRNQGLEGIEHVEIGPRVEVRGSEGGRGVQDQQVADSRGAA